MNREEAMAYVATSSRAMLATIRGNGRIQMSPIDYTLDEDGLIKIQVFEPAAKVKNATRDPRVSLSVLGDDWDRYIVVEGTAGFIDGEERGAALRHVYQRIAGRPHPDWQEFDRAMIKERQVIMTVSVDRLYPLTG